MPSLTCILKTLDISKLSLQCKSEIGLPAFKTNNFQTNNPWLNTQYIINLH